jgi:hypothetical protein
VYSIDGTSEGYTSTTTLIHKLFPTFNADRAIGFMMGGRNWAASPYYGKSPSQIKEGWRLNGQQAAEAGTKMHSNLEQYYNGLGHEEESEEWQHFQKFEEEIVKPRGLVPYRSEWTIFAEDIKLAGSIDMVYQKPDGTLAIYDWKR